MADSTQKEELIVINRQRTLRREMMEIKIV